MNVAAKMKLYIYSLMRNDASLRWISLRSFLAMTILALLFIYRGFVWTVFKLYASGSLKSHEVDAKVISVGNITFGGSGKTPLVEFLAKGLAAKGERIAVLMRGYGNDEREMAKRNLSSTPLLIGRDRVKNAERAIRGYGARTIILDDGFQHLRLKRDLDIVAIDAMNCSMNGTLMPSGILREPLSGLKRADIFVLTRCDESGKLEIIPNEDIRRSGSSGSRSSAREVATFGITEALRKINKDAPIFESYYKPVGLCEYPAGQIIDYCSLKGERVALLSAIGNPRYFRRMCEKASLNIVREFVFPDHHDYTSRDVAGILNACADDGVRYLITTQKDMVKLERLMDEDFPKQLKLYTLLIEVVIKGEEEFLKEVYSALRGNR